MPLASKLFRGDAKLEAAAVSDPAHIVPGAAGPHVSKIQQALIELDGADIDRDGSYGPETAAAVLAYKRKRNIINRSYQTQADNIVGQMTIAALDKEMREKEGPAGSAEILARTSDGRCFVQKAPPFPQPSSPQLNPNVVAAPPQHKPEFLPPDPDIIVAVVAILFKVRDVIRAATFRLTTADPFVTTQKLTVPKDPFQASVRQSLNMLDTVFSLGKLNNPRPAFENIKRVFRNMDVALNRSFETTPLIAPVLFVPNTHISMETNAAYTSAGGAFLPPKTKFKNLPELADRIYVCRNWLTETEVAKVSTLVHELAHFVSGQPVKIGDVVKKGRMLNSADRPRFDAIRSEEKIKSAEHYSFFSIVARFPEFLKPD